MELVEEVFIKSFTEIAERVHQTCIKKGFWDCEQGPNAVERNPYEMIALMHTELSECVEGLRAKDPLSSIPPFNCEEEELADVIVRIMDYAIGRGLHVAEALTVKLKYNASRPHMHGKTA